MSEPAPIDVFFSNKIAMDAAAVGYLAIVVVLAAWTYRHIEVACRTWFNDRSTRLAPRRSAPVAPAEDDRRAS